MEWRRLIAYFIENGNVEWTKGLNERGKKVGGAALTNCEYLAMLYNYFWEEFKVSGT